MIWGVSGVVFPAWGECLCWKHWPVSLQNPIAAPAWAKPSSQESPVRPVSHCAVYSYFTSSTRTVHYYRVYYRSMRYLHGTFGREQTGAIQVKFCLQKPCLVLSVPREEALVPEEKIVVNCPSFYSLLIAISDFKVLICSTKLLQFRLLRTRRTGIGWKWCAQKDPLRSRGAPGISGKTGIVKFRR